MGGMMAATFLAIFFVPMFFKFITDRRLSERRTASELRTEIEREHAQQATDIPHHVPLKTEDGHA
jgi:HAE1 family hydrophobic/amphiphilic exporter-1/multidrug efflux pump